METIRHGSNGWVLEEMDWDPDTGISAFLYSRKVPGAAEETAVVYGHQPTEERHSGWLIREPQAVFAARLGDLGKAARAEYVHSGEF